jgi:peptidoglycan/LPS O-acetylase OafA/YrhL
MDALAVGALVACWARARGGLARLAAAAPALLGASGAVVLGVAIWRGRLFGGDPWVEGLAFTPLAIFFGALLLLAAGPGAPRLQAALSGPRLRSAGRHSYGLYVLHYPIFHALEACGVAAVAARPLGGSRLPGVLLFTSVAGAATWVAALASWHLIEKRFLAWKVLFPYGMPDRAPHGGTAPRPAP